MLKILNFFRKTPAPMPVMPRPINLEAVVVPYNELEGEHRKGFCMAMDSLEVNSDFQLLIKSLKLKYVDIQLNGFDDLPPNEPITVTRAELARVAVATLDEILHEVAAASSEAKDLITSNNEEDDAYI